MYPDNNPAAAEGAATCEPEQGRKRRIGGAIVGCALASALVVGGALQFLTDHKTVVNDLALDTNLSIALTEPNWDADAAKQMVPDMEVAKDPTVTNDGTVSEYVFAKVKVPVFTGKVAGEDGKAVAVTDTDLFSFTPGAGWTQVGDPVVADGFRTYTYAYGTALDAGDAAAAVFDKVKTANLTEGIETTDTQITVDAFAIQSQGFDTPAAAWSAYCAQEVAAAQAGAGA